MENLTSREIRMVLLGLQGFTPPMALRTRVQLLIVCDTGIKSIRLISNAGPLRKLSSVVFPYAQLFDVDHYRGEPRKTFDQALAVVDNLVEFFLSRGQGKLVKGLVGFLHRVPIKLSHIPLVGRLC